MMAAINAKLEKAENDYASEQADDPPARKKRDDANADLAAALDRGQSAISPAVSAARRRASSDWRANCPPRPMHLRNKRRMRSSSCALSPATHTSKLGEFTTAGAADHLEEAQVALSNALAGVTAESKQLQDALGSRDTAAAEWTNVYQSCATLLEGYLRLGGRTDLADSVRPTVRRASGLELTPPAPTDSGPTEPATPPAPPTPTPAPTA
jgi:hypothetical protein